MKDMTTETSLFENLANDIVEYAYDLKERQKHNAVRRFARRMGFKYKKEIRTIREFLRYNGIIDSNPSHQRGETSPKLEGGKFGKDRKESKAQAIIRSILEGADIGQLTLHKVKKGKYQFESIDGGHRQRYIVKFINDDFTIEGLTFSELHPEDQEDFLDTELTFCIYENLPGWAVGHIFRILNETTDVNDQETLNSYGDVPVAIAIRQMARVIEGIDNKPHKLFSVKVLRSDGTKTHHYLNFDGLRMVHDEIVARTFYRYYDGGGLGSADRDDLTAMYSDPDLSESKVKSIQKKVRANLDFVFSTAECSVQNVQRGLTRNEFFLYSRLWLWMEEEFISFKVKNPTAYYLAVRDGLVPFGMNLSDQPDWLKEPSPFNGDKTKGQEFKSIFGYHRDHKGAIRETLNWLVKRIDFPKLMENGDLVLKDPVRLFRREWREQKLAEQGFKCAIDGKPLTMAEAHGAHIVPHSSGGETTYENLAMVRAEHNLNMGGMNLKTYKALFND
jgi:hypothetical protein